MTLQNEHLSSLLAIIEDYPYTFCTFEAASEMNLCLMDTVDERVVATLVERLGQLTLPFRINVMDYKHFHQRYRNEAMPELMMFRPGPNYLLNPNIAYPMVRYNRLCFLKNIVQHPQIEIGDYTYYHDFEDVHRFEKNVRYLYEEIGDRLVIGKFCMLAHNVQFLMNGAIHDMDGITAYPFPHFGGPLSQIPSVSNKKGNTIVGNDVWIGYDSVIMPGVTIGDGAIIGTRSLVTRSIPPYAIAVGQPAKVIRMRFSEEEIKTLLADPWWYWPIEKITQQAEKLLLSKSVYPI